MSEAIEDGVTGILVRPEDSKALAAAILRVLRDPVAARRIGAAARSQALGRFGIAASAEAHATAYEGASARRRHPSAVGRGSRRLTLEDLVVCPLCRGRLTIKRDEWTCGACHRRYPQVDGIPILLADSLAGHDEPNHKAAQSHHTDAALDDEFEVTRPHATAKLYRFLLAEKFRRATSPIRLGLVRATALTVCGGSGMDAEFLARSGAAVVSSDISLGAARRARERARRYGLDITVCVADAEKLPFMDGAFDLAYVHDGLHHLERPDVAFREMARVARRWVSITEPARARVTAFAVRAGLAREREDAGNIVFRLSPDTVVGWVEAAGYRPLVSERYAMYYRHKPGIVTDLLSARWSFPLTRLLWHVGNRAVGRAGNKMVVVAERHAPPTDSVVQSGPAKEDPHE
jgi:SAM-dependent methyltransferase